MHACRSFKLRTSAPALAFWPAFLTYLFVSSLLLDAINLTVPATPSLMHLTRPSPALYSHPVAPPAAAAPPPPHHMNGHSVPHANGRYRPVDVRSQVTPCHRHLWFFFLDSHMTSHLRSGIVVANTGIFLRKQRTGACEYEPNAWLSIGTRS